LLIILLVDRAIVKQTVGYILFYINKNYKITLLIELRFPTWRVLDWYKIRSAKDLLTIRTKQLVIRDNQLESIITRHRRKRTKAKNQCGGEPCRPVLVSWLLVMFLDT
jgi:hypothetical protein